jgi:hypothetical protein
MKKERAALRDMLVKNGYLPKFTKFSANSQKKDPTTQQSAKDNGSALHMGISENIWSIKSIQTMYNAMHNTQEEQTTA